MIKKILCIVIAITVCVNISFAKAGFYVSAGIRNHDSSFGNVNDIEYRPAGNHRFDSSFDDEGGSGFQEIGLFYEQPSLFNLKKNQILGISLGYIPASENQLEYGIYGGVYNMRIILKSDIFSVPVVVYYKHKLTQKISFKAGVGFTYISNVWKLAVSKYDETFRDSGSLTTSKLMPTLNAGFEWTFSRFLGLAFDFAYGFGGKVQRDFNLPEMDGNIYRDFSGFTGKAALKIYVI